MGNQLVSFYYKLISFYYGFSEYRTVVTQEALEEPIIVANILAALSADYDAVDQNCIEAAGCQAREQTYSSRKELSRVRG